MENVCQKAKMYPFEVDGKNEIKRNKCVKTYVVKNKITFDNYKSYLFSNDVPCLG